MLMYADVDASAPRLEQVFAAQLQLVRSQISRAKMRAEAIARRAPVGRGLGADAAAPARDWYAPGLEETLWEIKMSAARQKAT